VRQFGPEPFRRTQTGCGNPFRFQRSVSSAASNDLAPIHGSE
jgi:hypothetical protein